MFQEDIEIFLKHEPSLFFWNAEERLLVVAPQNTENVNLYEGYPDIILYQQAERYASPYNIRLSSVVQILIRVLHCICLSSKDSYCISFDIPGYYKRNRHFQCCIETKLLMI